MPTSIPISLGISLPADLLEFSFSSSSGPGGQNVNKRATKCTLRVSIDAIPIPSGARSRLASLGSHYLTDAGELILQADDDRSQERNRAACLEKLRALIVRSLVAPKPRRPTRPSRGAKERRLSEKKSRARIKRDRSSRHDT